MDCCLPIGCSISCAYFETFSTFLEWVVKWEYANPSILHCMDDFLFICLLASQLCMILLRMMEQISDNFGVPLAPDKTEGPSTQIKFLGILIDFDKMECRLPKNKLQDLRAQVLRAKVARKLRLRMFQSLLGKLNFACCILPMGQVFCRCLAMATAVVLVPVHFVHLTSSLGRTWLNGPNFWNILMADL